MILWSGNEKICPSWEGQTPNSCSAALILASQPIFQHGNGAGSTVGIVQTAAHVAEREHTAQIDADVEQHHHAIHHTVRIMVIIGRFTHSFCARVHRSLLDTGGWRDF